MKKIIPLFLIFSLLLSHSLPAQAAPEMIIMLCSEDSIVLDGSLHQIRHILTFADGSVLIETVPCKINSRSGSTTDQKTYYRMDSSNNLLWSATLTGSFTYNGVSSTCTAASCTTTIYDSAWSEKAVNAYASGSSANADVTMVRKFLFITVRSKPL